MLLQRVLTAIVLAPLMLAGIFLLPDFWFRIFIGIIVFLGAWEWVNVAGIESQVSRIALSCLLIGILFVINVLLPVTGLYWPATVMALLVWWVFATRIIFVYPNNAQWLHSKHLKLLVSLPVLGGFWMGVVWLKNQEQAVLLLTWLMLLVWGADIGAYFAGRAWGNRKLAPSVSPGKTWAGVYGGMVASIAVSILVAFLFLPKHSAKGWVWLICLSTLVVGVSVIGDLFESLLKRSRGIKDSSSLLPGHGGILDRIDSLCAATPVFVLLWYVLSVI